MTPSEAVAYIEAYTWSATRLGLERTRELLAALGEPQRQLKFVHVAGSNGKGSTCAMLASVLQRAGYRTGLYTSPYIQDFCERIQVDGENIPGPALAGITERVRVIADGMEDHPSQFELVTAIAMEYFRVSGCDIVVLEVGMGGALDSTNAIDAPEVAVITNIALEHTEYLGDTLEAIAATKAGIIKPGCTAVCYDGAPEVTRVIQTVCRERNVPLYQAEAAKLTLLQRDLTGQRFLWRDMELFIPLLGAHQLHNAALVLETVLALLRRGWPIGDEALREGLAATRWPARMEVLGRWPLFLLDGGHNPQCAQALADSLGELLPGRKAVFLMGVLADKDYGEIVAQVRPLAQEFVCLTPHSGRALPGQALAELLTGQGLRAAACDSVEEGISAALTAAGEDGVVVAFGSLYLAGAVRTAYPAASRGWLRKEKIRARESLSKEERADFSRRTVERILASEEYQKAKTIFLYRAVRGELTLAELESAALSDGKRLAFPLCLPERQMVALIPGGPDSWEPGAFHIPEPVPELSEEVLPEDIDLVLAPLTGFDEHCNRLGMGGGYYDRYLPRCRNATVAAVAFECQKARAIPTQPWDMPVELVFTEAGVYPVNP